MVQSEGGAETERHSQRLCVRPNWGALADYRSAVENDGYKMMTGPISGSVDSAVGYDLKEMLSTNSPKEWEWFGMGAPRGFCSTSSSNCPLIGLIFINWPKGSSPESLFTNRFCNEEVHLWSSSNSFFQDKQTISIFIVTWYLKFNNRLQNIAWEEKPKIINLSDKNRVLLIYYFRIIIMFIVIQLKKPAAAGGWVSEWVGPD